MFTSEYSEYKRREYCKAIQCPVQMDLEQWQEGSATYETLRQECKAHCRHTTYEFHHWLIENGYMILRADKSGPVA